MIVCVNIEVEGDDRWCVESNLDVVFASSVTEMERLTEVGDVRGGGRDVILSAVLPWRVS